jgi:hypothetical protein
MQKQKFRAAFRFIFLGNPLYELLAGESPIRTRGGLNELWDMKLEKASNKTHRHDTTADMQYCRIIRKNNL